MGSLGSEGCRCSEGRGRCFSKLSGSHQVLAWVLEFLSSWDHFFKGLFLICFLLCCILCLKIRRRPGARCRSKHLYRDPFARTKLQLPRLFGTGLGNIGESLKPNHMTPSLLRRGRHGRSGRKARSLDLPSTSTWLHILSLVSRNDGRASSCFLK